jgi:ribosome-binding ATPase YchF (GTP1/OBG family)
VLNNLNTIQEIKQKLEGLLKHYAGLQKKYAAQEVQLQKLEKENKEQMNAVELLKQQNFLLKSAVQDLDPSEKKQFDQKIGDYIKTIDKAIALLSE